MPIADASPERRNLSVLSLAIIVYYVGGGYVADSSISLPMLNIGFTRPTALVVLLWGTLLWLHFRYWQEMHGSGMGRIREELAEVCKRHPIVVQFLAQRIEALPSEANGFHVKDFRIDSNGWRAKYAPYKGGEPDSKGSVAAKQDLSAKWVTIQGDGAVSVKVRVTLSALRTEGSLWAYWAPHLLVLAAYSLGLADLLGLIEPNRPTGQPDC